MSDPATPRVETVELLATALWMFFDQPEDRSPKQTDYLIRAASAVDALVATTVTEAVREERERLATYFAERSKSQRLDEWDRGYCAAWMAASRHITEETDHAL